MTGSVPTILVTTVIPQYETLSKTSESVKPMAKVTNRTIDPLTHFNSPGAR